MCRVWRELTKHKRDNYRPTDKFFYQKPDRSPDTISIAFDKTLIAFFFWSCAAASPPQLLTKDERVKLSSVIKMLSPFGSGTPPLDLPPLIEVKRHTGDDDRVRASILVLAKACMALFDKALYSTIATTTSVALNTKVDSTYVRQVLRTHARY
jgi:hypothetical protein